MPAVSQGRPPSTPDEVAVSSTLGRQIGDDVEIASRRLHIVGIVENSTALANLPNVFLTTQGAQQLVYGGEPLVASIGIRGTLEQVPDGYRAIDRAGAIADLLRPLKVAVNSITIVAVMLWIVAALIVGSVDLSLRARAAARLRGVQGDWRADRLHRWAGWRCRRSWSRCVPRSSVPGFPRCWDRCSRCRSSSRCRPSSPYP